MGLLSNTYEIEKVVTKKLGFMNYDKNTVANGTLLPVNEGKVTLHLTGDNKGADFIDIYVKPKNPSKKTLILKNALDPTGLSAAEQETELKKTYKYQLFDAHTNDARNNMELLRNVYGSQIHIFDNYIPFSVRMKEAVREGQSIFSYDPKGKATEAYRRVTEEVLKDAI